MSPGPFTSLFFMISIWIRLTISVSVKSREIKGRGTRQEVCNKKEEAVDPPKRRYIFANTIRVVLLQREN
jgi:hypothetical protein